MFNSVLSSTTELTIENAALCTGVSLVLGLIIALVYMSNGFYTKSFAVSVVLMPALVQVVIMLVNGNLGVGIAVLGAFNLVRFRSVPGNSKEICVIFFAMAVGLATGMGYLTFAAGITVVLAIILFIMMKTSFGNGKDTEKTLKITIPEDVDYNEEFKDVFEKYTKHVSLESVKTVNLGSLFELWYDIVIKDPAKEKEFIDELRCRNGNLTIVCSRRQAPREAL